MDRQDLYREHKATSHAGKRITNIILNHWNNVRGDKAFPSESDLDPNELESVLDSCFLIKVMELMVSGQHKYIYIGKNILEAYGNQVTNPKDYNDVDPLSYKSKFMEVVETKQPVIEEGNFINKNGFLVKYRQCLVPLGKDGNIDTIFGGMRFRVFVE